MNGVLYFLTSYSYLLEGQPSSGGNMEMCVKSRRLQGMSGVNEPYWYDISCDNQLTYTRGLTLLLGEVGACDTKVVTHVSCFILIQCSAN